MIVAAAVLCRAVGADHAAHVLTDDRRLRVVEPRALQIRDVRADRLPILQVLRDGCARRRLAAPDVVPGADLVAVATVDRLAHLVPEERATRQGREVSISTESSVFFFRSSFFFDSLYNWIIDSCAAENLML